MVARALLNTFMMHGVTTKYITQMELKTLASSLSVTLTRFVTVDITTMLKLAYITYNLVIIHLLFVGLFSLNELPTQPAAAANAPIQTVDFKNSLRSA